MIQQTINMICILFCLFLTKLILMCRAPVCSQKMLLLCKIWYLCVLVFILSLSLKKKLTGFFLKGFYFEECKLDVHRDY